MVKQTLSGVLGQLEPLKLIFVLFSARKILVE